MRYILTILFFAIFGLYITWLYLEEQNCNGNNGVMVRGIFYYKCIYLNEVVK